MANEKTKADALGIYLSGAASDGGVQTDPAESLGGFRSSTETRQIYGLISTGIPALIIESVTGANGVGSASIVVDGSEGVKYTPHGGTVGDTVTMADGETKLIEGTDNNKAIRVTRDAATMATGKMTINLVEAFNGAFGMPNVTSAERAAGEEYYLAVFLYPHGDFSVGDTKAWLTVTGTQATYEIAYEEPASDGSIQTIADINTAPSGLSWSTPTTKGAASKITVISNSHGYGLWIHKQIASSSTVSADEEIVLNFSYLGSS